jgi:hypothetical protein
MIRPAVPHAACATAIVGPAGPGMPWMSGGGPYSIHGAWVAGAAIHPGVPAKGLVQVSRDAGCGDSRRASPLSGW